MNILYEDKQIIVCIKPEGMLSQSDDNGGESAVTILQQLTGGDIFPVHRLDRTTEGLMVFAKTKNAAAELSKVVASHSLLKRYYALVHGEPNEKSGVMEDLIFYDRRKSKSFVVKRERGGVKKAVLEYMSEKKGDYTAMHIILHTGRTHQIRVQCASRGMPLLGDHRYGAKDNFSKIALYSVALEFMHPTEKRKMQFCMENTKEFEMWLQYFVKTEEC